MTAPLIVVSPTTEPVTVWEAKQHLREENNYQNEEFFSMAIRAAREYFEWRTGRALYQQTLKYVLYQWPCENWVELPRATPLQSISSVVYRDSTGASTTWDSGDYVPDTDAIPGRLVLGYGESWPSFTPYPVSPISITYVAGQLEESPPVIFPATVSICILELVAGIWENRESEIISQGPQQLTTISTRYGVESKIAMYMAGHVF